MVVGLDSYQMVLGAIVVIHVGEIICYGDHVKYDSESSILE